MLITKPLKIGTIVKNTTSDLLLNFLSAHNSLPETQDEEPQRHSFKNILIPFLEQKVVKNWLLMNDLLLIEGYSSGIIPTEDLYLFLKTRHENLDDVCKNLPQNPYDRIITLLLLWCDDVRQHFRLRYYLLSGGKSSRFDRRDYFEGGASSKILSTDLEMLRSTLENKFSEFLQRINKSGKIVHFDCAILDSSLHIAVIGRDESIAAEDIKENTVEYTPINPPLYLGVVISAKRQLVEVYAKGASLQRHIHKEIASSLFGIKNLPDHPENNEVYDTQTVFEKLLQYQKLQISLPAPFISIAPKEIVCIRTRPPWNILSFRVWRVNADDCGSGLYNELRDFLYVDSISRNTVRPSCLKARKIHFTAFYKDQTQQEQSFDFHIKSNGQTDLHRGELHQKLRDALVTSGFIRGERIDYPETATQLMAILLPLITPKSPEYSFTSDSFRYLPEDSLFKLVETGWISFHKDSRKKQCGVCQSVQIQDNNSLSCEQCGNASIYVRSLYYGISVSEVVQSTAKIFDLSANPQTLINNQLFFLGFSDVAYKHIFLCLADEPINQSHCLELIAQQAQESIVLYTAYKFECLSVLTQQRMLFLPLLDRMKWTDKTGFTPNLPQVKASNLAQKKGGKARAEQYKTIKEWCRNKFQELRKISDITKTKKEALCRDVAEAAVKNKIWIVFADEEEASAAERLFENLYVGGWLKGLK